MDKIDIKKYDIIFNTSIDDLEQTLQTLCHNYYRSIQENDSKSIEQYLQELRKYLDLKIPSLTQYIEYLLLLASNEILKDIIADDVPLYNPSGMNLSFKSYKDRQAERIIKQENLTPKDVALIVENNLSRLDIYCLQLNEYDFQNLKEAELPEHLHNSRLLSMNYLADYEAIASAKLYFAMSNAFSKDFFQGVIEDDNLKPIE